MGIIKVLLILLLIFISGFLYYQFTEPYITGNAIQNTERQNITIIRAVDGDTFKDAEGNTYRMLGINTPEKKQPFHDEAWAFMKQYENKTVLAEVHEKDKYGRYLAYIFDEKNQLINKKQLELGYANLYYYGEDEHFPEMKKAEENARNFGLGIWKKSQNFGCVELIKLQWNEGKERCVNAEQLILSNSCSELSVIIKDSANHIENENLQTGVFVKNYSCVWNDDGDAMTVRDESGLLLYYAYP